MAAAVIGGVVGLLILLIGFGMVMTLREESRDKPRRPHRRQARRERKLLAAHQEFLHRLHSSALAHAQVDPYAQIVLDDLANHLKNINEIEAP